LNTIFQDRSHASDEAALSVQKANINIKRKNGLFTTIVRSDRVVCWSKTKH